MFRPNNRGNSASCEIKCEQLPKHIGNIVFKIAIYLSCRKGQIFNTDTIKLVSWITYILKIRSIPINHTKPGVFINHHISQVKITVVKRLRPIYEEMLIRLEVI